ncbi:hypothetical protein SAMN05661096_00874 [Marivirga sericea]|uniref:Uncharacterized protein n=1 Tax=Marivirga sericea TaxID=1028 RepID=A0A1X7IPA7_9BACT|nr:hypothetical protein [Marivirga sericea]SMG16589.1 hypothetical protein SAMN05661096_00874 [Marivirga sericea]
MKDKFEEIEEVESLLKDFNSWLYSPTKITDFQWYDDFEELIEKKNKKYPDVLPSISQNEVQQLSEFLEEDIQASTALEKVLLSIIWKQGDYGKIKSFIETICGQEKALKTGIVFRQFARHVNNPLDQPIIDQHVLRAYLALQNIGDIDELKNIRKRGVLTYHDEAHIENYLNWYNMKAPPIKFKSDYKLDDYLFVLGKLIKTK